ncbi:MAG: hypothetical protein IPN06_07310 [Burkholderiales bacterium]|nr:hypothetical protein [Burkholderiales bacterium]
MRVNQEGACETVGVDGGVGGACTASQAQTVAQAPGGFAGGGMASGGDTIFSGTITTDGTTQVVPFQVTPGGPKFRLGGDYRLGERITVQGSVGMSTSDPMGYNGSLTFANNPVELLVFANLTDALRAGLGVRQSFARMAATGKGGSWPGVGRYESNAAGRVAEVQLLVFHRR